MGEQVECRNPDPGDHRSPFPPELSPAQQRSRVQSAGGELRARKPDRDLETPRPQSQAQPRAPPSPKDLAEPEVSLSPQPPSPRSLETPPRWRLSSQYRKEKGKWG